jgi:cystathionine beta-lyase
MPGACAQEFFLERARVGLSAGQDFDDEALQCVRLNFATGPDLLERVLSRLSGSLEGIGRR